MTSPTRHLWLTTDGPSWFHSQMIVHVVEGDTRQPNQWASALCGARPQHGWYGDYSHEDGGLECDVCAERALPGRSVTTW